MPKVGSAVTSCQCLIGSRATRLARATPSGRRGLQSRRRLPSLDGRAIDDANRRARESTTASLHMVKHLELRSFGRGLEDVRISSPGADTFQSLPEGSTPRDVDTPEQMQHVLAGMGGVEHGLS